MDYVTLTCAYSELGREEKARAAAGQVLKMKPNFVLQLEQGATKAPFYDWFLKHERKLPYN